MVWRILALPIEIESDIVAVRQRARALAELLGFARQDQTRIATAVSEIARNAFGYAGKGRAEFMIVSEQKRQSFRIRISDSGNGIADLQSVLDGQFRSASGMGLGLIGARRLMDEFKIESEPAKGTVVELGQWLPANVSPVTQARLADIVSRLKEGQSNDTLAALREQNRELMQSLEENRRLHDESLQLNRELVDTNRGVVALYAELDERAEQLRTASELKSRFLSHMSHEVRTPLNSILALSRLLLERVDGDLSAEQERQVGFIRRSAEGLLDLVNDLLDLSKVEAGKIDVKPAAFGVQSLFGALRGALRPLLTSPSVELIFDVEDDMPDLVTDEGKVAQILRNLISNALKFTEFGEVRVTAHHQAKDGLAIFSVRDTGIGIAIEDQARIFDEFSQVDTRLHKNVKGTGLGLHLSRSLAELIGGTVHVESVLSQGSIFILTLPVVFGTTVAGGRPDLPHVEATSRRRVLVIDDDETFRYVIKHIVNHDPLFEILEASDGDQGLQRARNEEPDVIVLDLQMPNRDGFSVLRELAIDARTRAIPVIVSTSLAVNDELKERLPAGTRIVAKDLVTRENISRFLRDATALQGAS